MVCYPSTMCSKCEDILIGYSIPHPVFVCPLQREYCSICCERGHTTKECTDYEVVKHRSVQFVEQLIPYTIAQQYNITILTPISTKPQEPKTFEPVLEVEDSDEAIRAVLRAINPNVAPSGIMKENRRRLKQHADSMKRKLVYITPK